jgi:hypothetical protein
MQPPSNSSWFSSWETLHAHAWWRLNHSGQLSPCLDQRGSFREYPRLRIWGDAIGFACGREPKTLTVFESFAETGNGEAFIREAVWERSADLRRLHDKVEVSGQLVAFEPTVKVRDGDVPTGPFWELLKEASSIRIPVIWRDDIEAISTDVGAVGFEFFSADQPPAVVRLQWSHGKPKTWEPIAEWFSRLRAFLDGCLSTNPGGVQPTPSADGPDIPL